VLLNPLADYNLLLLRKIYDSYDERADKVVKLFRSDNHNIIRKRYMVPILNPNYDYDKLLEGMKSLIPDKCEEESVHMDGQTVCEDVDRQLMEAIQQEGMDDLCFQEFERPNIDKFGNIVDPNRVASTSN
jgi:hypothetical protein